MPKKISPELKARAIRMVAEHQEDYPSVTAAARAVAKQLGLGRETVRRWVVQAEIPSPMGGGFVALMDRAAADEIAATRRGRVGRLDAFTVEPPPSGGGRR